MSWPARVAVKAGRLSTILAVRRCELRVVRADAKKRAPSNAHRRANSFQPPRAAMAAFVIALQKVARDFARAVGPIARNKVKAFSRDEREGEAPSKSEVAALRSQLRAAAKRSFNEAAFMRAAAIAGRRAAAHAEQEARRLGLRRKRTDAKPKTSVGVNVVEGPMKWLVNGWSKDQAARVKGMQQFQADRIARILEGGFTRHVESLADEIEEAVGESIVSSAELIARDSILTINSKICQQQMAEAEVESFIWTTSGDERVREEHEDLDGEELPMDTGDPEEGFPGEPINCRCTMFPVLPELAEGEEPEDDEG